MTLIQVDGLSGTGKTTLVGEFERQGHRAIDADSAFAYFADPVTGFATKHEVRSNWKWNGAKLRAFADAVQGEMVFVCGGALNSEDFKDLFVRRFVLVIDTATMRRRLLTRTDNDFGKDPAELAEQLELNRSSIRDAEAIGAVVIDATQPIEKVAAEIVFRARGPVPPAT